MLEAPEGSGAIITADLALDYARAVFAVPGQIYDPNYAGCHDLIRRNKAMLATNAQTVLQELGIVTPDAGTAPSNYQPTTPDEEKILSTLTTMPQRVDELVAKTGLPAAAIGTALTMMELGGGAKNTGGGAWIRS